MRKIDDEADMVIMTGPCRLLLAPLALVALMLCPSVRSQASAPPGATLGPPINGTATSFGGPQVR